ncbi:hypothetical protein [Methylomonas methanica]|uniref:Uncharacterized protein n=1 Tax=Methylomonas methanica (strain DSM 25384 / MC09) TaxID=857087 RepID=G0A199_METMM|nr:hypothetical protein [Methylomonas methanica]AEG02519.1 hypothetical protein Metme_4168 [Methylomonas methanica MC09]
MLTSLRIIFMALLLSGIAWSVETLTPETYVRLNSQARKLTMDGMETRIGLLKNGASQEEQLAAAEQTNQAVESLFKSYGTTGSLHTAYGTYHQEQISAWLEANPVWNQTEVDLNQRFQALSSQIDVLLKGQ